MTASIFVFVDGPKDDGRCDGSIDEVVKAKRRAGRVGGEERV
jgi:hypothetical protein